jgi:hypothetical protein
MSGSRILAVALALSLGAALVFASLWRDAREKAKRVERISVQPVYQRVLLDPAELAALKKLGLSDPPTALRTDLATHHDILPQKGVLGGTMAFYDKEAMVLLPGRYVYAEGDDGHYLVHAILRYDVKPGGKITWNLIDSRPD